MFSSTVQAVQTVRKTSIALAIVATAAFTLVAHARQPWDPPRKAVNYSDLNLNTPEGAAVLYKRIKSAAREVCDVYDGSLFPQSHNAEVKACIGEAIDHAVMQVNRPMLTNLYKAKTGQTGNQLTAAR